MGAFLNVVVFPKISGLYQKHMLPWNQLEKLGEVFKNNFLTAMQDLKRRIKAGTAKNRCHTISERSLNILSVNEKLPVSKFRYFKKYIIQLFGYCYVHVSGQRHAGLER